MPVFWYLLVLVFIVYCKCLLTVSSLPLVPMCFEVRAYVSHPDPHFIALAPGLEPRRYWAVFGDGFSGRMLGCIEIHLAVVMEMYSE